MDGSLPPGWKMISALGELTTALSVQAIRSSGAHGMSRKESPKHQP